MSSSASNTSNGSSAGPHATGICVQGLHMVYDGQGILADLTLDLAGGSMIGLIGPNGAGKTTLLKLFMRLLSPTAGKIWLNERPLARYARRALARQVTLVSQDAHIGFAFSVEDIVAMGRNPHLGRFAVADRHDLKRIRQAMQQTAVAKLAKRRIDTLSGGERQRTMIARAITQETPIVLLDEVTANLDLCHQLEVMEIAQGMARSGRLVIAALHDLNLAARYCDRLLLLAQGQIQADGPPGQVLTQMHLRRYFGIDARIDIHPSTAGLQIVPLRAAA